MSGKSIRLAGLFRGKKNLVISAVDHVVEYGTQDGLENAGRALSACAGADAMLLPRAMLEREWKHFAAPGAPVPVVRLNWTAAFYYPLGYREGHTALISSAEEAVRAGAGAVICSLFLEEGDRKMEMRNVELFSEAVRQTERLGVPLIGECYVVEHKEKTPDQVHDKVKRVSRVMAELGADLIKTFYTGRRFREVVENTPVPVFTIGAEKLDTDLDVLKKADVSARAGARGVIFGRNIFMSKHPQRIIAALNAVINRKMRPEAAARKFKLK
jgi:DhnA family fructose-bisphosphate aldolase class Ia